MNQIMRDFKFKDYYKTLRVKPGCEADEIKRAYRKLARENHPDFNPSNRASEDRLKEINQSYEILMDPVLRRQVDSWLKKEFFTPEKYFSVSGDEEEPFCYENLLSQEWKKTVKAAKWAGLFFLPPALYIFADRYDELNEILKVFVILFVGVFYVAMVMTGKAVFHGATVLVMRSSETKRLKTQVLITLFIFVLPLSYLVKETSNWSVSAERFFSHTWIWFMFAIVIAGLTWTFSTFYRSPMISQFPFRLFLLAVFLTFILVFCKAIPMVDKGEALFDYIFFNIAIQTGLFISIRVNKKKASIS